MTVRIGSLARGGEHAGSAATPVLVSPRHRVLTLIALCGTSFLLSFDTSLHSIAVPTLLQQLGRPEFLHRTQWIPRVYLLAFIAMLVIGGMLIDRLGAKRVLIGGYLLYLGGLLAHIPLSFTQIPLGLTRVTMGIGVAAAIPASLTILVAMTQPGPERARVVTLWGGFCGAGVTIIPLISGVFLNGARLGQVAAAVWLIGTILLIMVVLFVPPVASEPVEMSPTAWPATLTAATASGLAAFALIMAPKWGWTTPSVAGPMAAAAVLWCSAAIIRCGGSLPHDCLIRAGWCVRMAMFGLTAATVALSGIVFLVVQYLQAVRSGPPVVAGAIVFLPSCGAAVLGARWGRAVRTRYSVGATLTVGLTAILDGLAIGLTAGAGGELAPIVMMVTAASIGFGMVASAALYVLSVAMPSSGLGMAWAAPISVVQLGGLLGLAVVGSFVDRGYHDRLLVPSVVVSADGAVVGNDSLGKGLAVAASVGTHTGTRLADAVRSAFLTGYRHGLFTTMGIIATAIVAVLVSYALTRRSIEHGRVGHTR
ncbi:MFS transporter [Nocardia sp. NPDC005366]|uniref:MFS transporter n=1 Tax=Nocardia sp. NPDC005366 TaxID=3156878 RepID=UPI00339FA032